MTENDQSLEQVAQTLADAHRRSDPNTCEVRLAPDKSGREIRLVEVSKAAPYTGEIIPVRFPARGEVAFPTVVILLSQREWEEVKAGALKLPSEWGSFRSLRAL